MNNSTIIIHTQEEFNKLPDAFDTFTRIEIVGSLNQISRAIKNAELRILGNATVQYVYGNATVQYVSGNATVQSVSGNATVKIYAPTVKILRASTETVIILQNCNPKLSKAIRGHVVRTKIAKTSKEDFCAIYGLNEKDILLYKSVRPDNERDFHTNTLEYKTGSIVTAPDWKADKSIECGNGLHLSPRPEMALRYNQGKLRICRVKKSDFVIFQANTTKVRCRKVEVIGDYVPEVKK